MAFSRQTELCVYIIQKFRVAVSQTRETMNCLKNVRREKNAQNITNEHTPGQESTTDFSYVHLIADLERF